MKYIVIDQECDGLENPTKIHCLAMNWGGEIRVTTDYDSMRKLLSMPDITLVGHNLILFDIPVLERILNIKISCGVIDTLPLSWYLYPEHNEHGLEVWGERLGIKKPPVDDWENLPIEVYKERCKSDVAINVLLWNKICSDLSTLYDEEKARESLIRYLMFKIETVEIQEQNPFKLDIERCKSNLDYLEGLKEEKMKELKAAMPTVGVKVLRKPPKIMFKKDGELSANGVKWQNLCEEHGLPNTHNEPIEVVKDYEEPNPNSPEQLKAWLFSLGWEPENFKEGANGKVPQISLDDPEKSLCPSVLRLGHPAVESLHGIGVLKHRIGLLKGFLRDQRDGYIYQSIAGFTSTLRLRHKYLVNLPKPSVPYGDLVRGVLTCDEGYEICGADLAALENRTKEHFIYPLDPEYVKETSAEGYCAHLALAVFAGALTEEQAEAHKEKREDHTDIRHLYKTCNYAATYQVGARKLSKTLNIPQPQAKGILDAYWAKNWAVKRFADGLRVKNWNGSSWILNPLNRYWYPLRSEKDRFSAVNQSAGAYIFDLWVRFAMDMGLKKVTLQSHDESGRIIKAGNRAKVEQILNSAIEKVNKTLKLNREMAIDIKWGKYYSETH